MSPHPRIRRMIKWGKIGGASVTALLLAAWIASGWWMLTWRVPSGHFLHIWMSDVVIGQDPFFKNSGFQGLHLAGPHQFELHWSFSKYLYPRGWAISAPMWALAAAAALATAGLVLLDRAARRRENTGHCPNCGYDRAGISKNAKCPECGAAPPGT